MGPIANQILTHYDEINCIAVALSDNSLTGGHVVPLPEAYSNRYQNIRALLTTNLLPKREQLIQIRRRLQNASVEVESTKRAIEQETKSDSEQIIQRLTTVEALRQSKISQEVLRVEAELDAIDRLIGRVEHANRDSSKNTNTGIKYLSAIPGAPPLETVQVPRAIGMVEFIHDYPDLSSRIQVLSTKPLSVQVDFPTDDFPRETAERLEVISRCDRMMHAVAVKDQMLWTALQDKARAEEQLLDERRLSHAYAEETAQWAEVAQELKRQLAVAEQERSTALRDIQDMREVMRKHNIYYNVRP